MTKAKLKTEVPATAQRSGGCGCSAVLAELDELYKKFKELNRVATWGGSFEREHAAAMELKPVVNKMFDTLLKLLEERSANTSRHLRPETKEGE